MEEINLNLTAQTQKHYIKKEITINFKKVYMLN